MFERFNDEARRSVVLAQQEARLLNHDHIGSAHILLGLLRVPDGPAARVLGGLGVTADAARGEVEHLIGRGARRAPRTTGISRSPGRRRRSWSWRYARRCWLVIVGVAWPKNSWTSAWVQSLFNSAVSGCRCTASAMASS
jgi:Clp amino terminal domain, pathogenicity island component